MNLEDDEPMTETQRMEKERLDAMLRGEVPRAECEAYVKTKLNQPHPDDPTWRGCIVCGTLHTMGHRFGCPISALRRMLTGKDAWRSANGFHVAEFAARRKAQP